METQVVTATFFGRRLGRGCRRWRLILLDFALFTTRSNARRFLLCGLWGPSFGTGITLRGTLTGIVWLQSLCVDSQQNDLLSSECWKGSLPLHPSNLGDRSRRRQPGDDEMN